MNNENEFKILDIPSNTQYWFVRANSRAEYYDDFLQNNYIAVDSSSISLNTLLDIPQTLRSSKDALKDRYKQLFQENALSKFDKRSKDEKMSDKTRKKERAAVLKRSSYRSGIVFHFVEDMNIGDFVVIPYKSAEKFLIGTVVTNCFENEIDHVEDLDENSESNYAISPFKLKRKILWIKELPKSKFPDKLSWIESAHQSIFNITGYGNELNPFINPLYRYKGKIYARIGVNTDKEISSSSWLDYQLTMKDILSNNLGNVFQKLYVQSPGQIIIYVKQNLYWLVPLLIGCLFGKVEIKHGDFKINFVGIFRYFSKTERQIRNLDVEEKKAKIDNIKADSSNKYANSVSTLSNLNDKNSEGLKHGLLKEIENSAISNDDKENDKQELENKFSIESMEKKIDFPKNIQKIEKDKNNLQKELKLSNENPGSLIQFENQKDNLIPSTDEFEKEEEKKEQESEK